MVCYISYIYLHYISTPSHTLQTLKYVSFDNHNMQGVYSQQINCVVVYQPLELDDDIGCHGKVLQNLSGNNEEISIIELDPEQYSHLCQICYREQVQVLLLPCRHAKMCDSCAVRITVSQNKPCPHCKTPVESIQRIYL